MVNAESPRKGSLGNPCEECIPFLFKCLLMEQGLQGVDTLLSAGKSQALLQRDWTSTAPKGRTLSLRCNFALP